MCMKKNQIMATLSGFKKYHVQELKIENQISEVVGLKFNQQDKVFGS